MKRAAEWIYIETPWTGSEALRLKERRYVQTLLVQKHSRRIKLPCFYLKPAKFFVTWFFATTKFLSGCCIHYSTIVPLILPLRGSARYIPAHKCEGFIVRFGKEFRFQTPGSRINQPFRWACVCQYLFKFPSNEKNI